MYISAIFQTICLASMKLQMPMPGVTAWRDCNICAPYPQLKGGDILFLVWIGLVWIQTKLGVLYIFEWVKDLILFCRPGFQGHHIDLDGEKWALSAHYLENQPVDSDQTCMNTLLGVGLEVIMFWWPWPYFQGHRGHKNVKIIPKKSLSALCLLKK